MSFFCKSIDRSGPLPAAAARPFKAGAVLSAVLAAILFIPAPAASETPPEGLKLEQIVPGDTVLFIECSGVDRLLEESGSLDLFKLWAEPEIQAFFAGSLEMLPEMLGACEESEEFPVRELWDLFKGETAVALSPHLTVFEKGALPSTVVAMDMGSDPEAFLGKMHGLLGMATEMAGLEQERMEYRGFDIGVIDLPPERLAVCHTTIQNLFVATANRYFLQEIIDIFADNRPGLSQNATFKRCMQRAAGGGAGIAAFVNLDPLYAAVRPFWPYEAKEWLDMLGLNGIDAVCYATSLEGGGSRDSLFIHCPGEKKGLLKALAPHPVSRRNLALAPPNTLFFVDAVIDPELILKEVDGFIRKVLPEHHGEFLHGLAMIKKETGLDLEKDVLAPLGSEITFFMNMPQGGGMAVIPDLLLSVALDDEEGFQALMDRVLAMLGIEVSETSFGDLTLRYFSPPEPGVPLSPAYVIDGGRLLVSGSPITLRKHLKRIAEGGPGLDSTDAFKEAAAGIPDNASIIEYVNVRRLVGLIYENGVPFLPSLLAESEMPFDAGLLPMSETITRNISSGFSYMTMDDDGILMSGRWSLGLGALLTTAVSLTDYAVEKGFVAALLLREIGEPEEITEEIEFMEEEEPLDEELEAAFTLMEQEQYAAAETILSGWLQSHPDHGLAVEALTSRGYCRMAQKQYESAIKDYERAVELDPEYAPLAYYNIACAYSVRDMKGKALDYLNRAIEAGFDDFEYMAEDPDLDNIRELITVPPPGSMKKTSKPVKKI